MRVVNRFASALLGLALIVGGLWAVVEVTLAALGRAPFAPLRDWYRWMAASTRDDPVVRWVSIGLIVLGLIVLVSQLRPWRPQKVDLRPGNRDWPWHIQRKSLEEQVSAAVAAVPGVAGARAAVKGRQHRWRLRVHAFARSDKLDEARQAARRALDRLAVGNDVRVDVAVRAPITRRVT